MTLPFGAKWGLKKGGRWYWKQNKPRDNYEREVLENILYLSPITIPSLHTETNLPRIERHQ